MGTFKAPPEQYFIKKTKEKHLAENCLHMKAYSGWWSSNLATSKTDRQLLSPFSFVLFCFVFVAALEMYLLKAG